MQNWALMSQKLIIILIGMSAKLIISTISQSCQNPQEGMGFMYAKFHKHSYCNSKYI